MTTIARCANQDPHETHPWTPEPKFLHGEKRCPGVRDDETRADEPALGDTGVCRTCAQPIWWEEGEVGHRKDIGWSDRIERGGDSLVCFKAIGYRHVPMGSREEAIYRAGFKAGQATPTPSANQPRRTKETR